MITKGKWYLTKNGMGISTHKNRILPNIASVTCPDYENLLKYTGVSETIEQEIFANAELFVKAPQTKQQRDELLEACKIAILALTHTPINPDDIAFIQQAIASVEAK